jgi:hypothetical protein
MKLALAMPTAAEFPDPGVGDLSQSEYFRAAALDFAKRRRAPICPARCRVLKFSWDRPQNNFSAQPFPVAGRGGSANQEVVLRPIRSVRRIPPHGQQAGLAGGG